MQQQQPGGSGMLMQQQYAPQVGLCTSGWLLGNGEGAGGGEGGEENQTRWWCGLRGRRREPALVALWVHVPAACNQPPPAFLTHPLPCILVLL